MFAYLVEIWYEWWTYGPRSSRCERLVLEECPHCTCCGKPRTQRLRGIMVPVQDGTGMEICNANYTCTNLLDSIKRSFAFFSAVILDPAQVCEKPSRLYHNVLFLYF